MSNDMSAVYASTRSGSVSPILALGIFILVLPLVVGAFGISIPFKTFITVLGVIIIGGGLLHQVIMNI